MTMRKRKPSSIYAGWPRYMWHDVLEAFVADALKKAPADRTPQEKAAIRRVERRDQLERD